jgi:hypothetical protein
MVVYEQMFLNVLTSNGLRTGKCLILQECSDVRFYSKIVYTSQKPLLFWANCEHGGLPLRWEVYYAFGPICEHLFVFNDLQKPICEHLFVFNGLQKGHFANIENIVENQWVTRTRTTSRYFTIGTFGVDNHR